MALAFVAAVLDACVIVMLIPLLEKLFGDAGALSGAGAPWLVTTIHTLLDPITAGQPDSVVIGRLVLLFLAVVFLKNLATYVSAYLSVLVQEGMVRDLRVRLYHHLLRLDLSVMQRTRGGQLATALVGDADTVKSVAADHDSGGGRRDRRLDPPWIQPVPYSGPVSSWYTARSE